MQQVDPSESVIPSQRIILCVAAYGATIAAMTSSMAHDLTYVP